MTIDSATLLIVNAVATATVGAVCLYFRNKQQRGRALLAAGLLLVLLGISAIVIVAGS